MKKSAAISVKEKVHKLFSDWGSSPYYKWHMYSELLKLINSKKIGMYEVWVIGEGFGFDRDVVKMRLNDLRKM